MKRAASGAGAKQLQLSLEPPAAFTTHDPSIGSGRSILLGSEIVQYRLYRVRRRTIGFQVDEHGLTIRAPRSISMREIERAITESERWIFAKRLEWRAWREQHGLSAPRFVDGGSVQYLGQAATLRLNTSTAHFNGETREIHLAVPTHASEADVRQALLAWLHEQARSTIGERLERFSARTAVRFAGWRLSSARTQWGSCSHNGRIRLNWRLIHFSLPVIDYVIAHELAHLRELNHGRGFWDEVTRLLPGFEQARDQIRHVKIDAISF